jgi:hypothetical protein
MVSMVSYSWFSETVDTKFSAGLFDINSIFIIFADDLHNVRKYCHLFSHIGAYSNY